MGVIDHAKVLDVFGSTRTIGHSYEVMDADDHVGRGWQSWLRNVLVVMLKTVDHGAALPTCAGIAFLPFCSD
jgi:hypothetical protein